MSSGVSSTRIALSALFSIALLTGAVDAQRQAAADGLPYDSLAARIVTALRPDSGEHAILRVHPSTMAGLVPPLEQRLRRAGVTIDVMDYGQVADFVQRLERATIYVLLPTPSPAVGPTPEQRGALTRWVQSKRGRQVHFHWSSITTTPDGFNVPFPPGFDAMHTNAVLGADYGQMRRDLDRLAERLRAGDVRVTTPAGTDLRFSIGGRPINQQDGDGSRAALAGSRIPIDREIELPAGVLRVAPIEASVHGSMVIPALHLDATTIAHDVHIRFAEGRAAEITAESQNARVQQFFSAAPALSSFRELGIGVNPLLVVARSDTLIPFAGYGAGIVRLGLGDNIELGGTVSGVLFRWLLFRDATVVVGRDTLVAAGRLMPQRGVRASATPSSDPIRHRVVADGHPLTVWEKRPARAPRGSVLFVHGRTWSSLPNFDLRVPGQSRSVMDAFVARGYVAYALDQRGYGGTPRDSTGWLTPTRAVADVAAVLDWIAGREQRNPAPKPALLGYSRGSAVALLTAHQHATKLSALVLYAFPNDLDTAFVRTTEPPQPPRQRTMPEAAASDFITPAAASRAVIAAYVTSGLTMDSVRVDWRREDEFNAFAPESVRVPTLLIRGELDPLATAAENAKLFTRLGVGDRTLVVLPGAGHAAHLEHTHSAFVGAVVDFLERPGRRR